MQEDPHQMQGIRFIIDKCQSIAVDKGITIQLPLKSQAESNYFDQILKQYSEHQINFGKISAEKYLEEALLSIIPKIREGTQISMNMAKDEKGNTQSIDSNKQELKTQIIFVKKYRQNDQILAYQWRDARKGCFDKQNEISFADVISIVDNEYRKKMRESVPIQTAIQNKITNLKVIHIQYTQLQLQPLASSYEFRYAVSAFDLFKLVHQNTQLTEVTVIGVLIQQFQDFIEQIKASKENKSIMKVINTTQLSWMKDFSPSKSLKLSIDTELWFQFPPQSEIITVSRLQQLIYFADMFHWISDITIRMNLGLQDGFNRQGMFFYRILMQLKKLKKGKIEIQGWLERVSNYAVSNFRAVLFGQIATFTELKHLKLQQISFRPQLSINNFLAMEQSLRTLFENNKITHLVLHKCYNFPILPRITSLKSIDIKSVSFRRQFLQMSEIILTNPSLKFIKCEHTKMVITEELFNKLQILNIHQCDIVFDNISPDTPSHIKTLCLYESIESPDCLLVILPKLSSLVYLQLSEIDFGDQVLCVIPSPHLKDLHISQNHEITNEGVRNIDEKWPLLKHFSLDYCTLVTEDAWEACSFTGLLKLRCFGTQNRIENFRKRGIIVFT